MFTAVACRVTVFQTTLSLSFAVYARSNGITWRNNGMLSMSEPRILRLNLVRKFFDQIAIGEKREEYRDRSDYWKTRLEGREYDIVRFRNGYGPDVPEMDVEWKGIDKRKDWYAILLGEIRSLKRWQG